MVADIFLCRNYIMYMQMLHVSKLGNTTARQCDRQVYVHIFLNWLHGPQIPYLKLFCSVEHPLCHHRQHNVMFNFCTLLLNHTITGCPFYNGSRLRHGLVCGKRSPVKGRSKFPEREIYTHSPCAAELGKCSPSSALHASHRWKILPATRQSFFFRNIEYFYTSIKF